MSTLWNGTGGDDTIVPGGLVSAGVIGAPVLDANPANFDAILAGAGDDTADAGAGNDTLLGGDGDDSLQGGAGNDSASGEAGNDALLGGTGRDALSGGDGADILSDHTQDITSTIAVPDPLGFAPSDADTLTGGAGIDVIYASGGGDVIDGGDDSDFLVMSFATQILFGVRFTYSEVAPWTVHLGARTTATVSNVESLTFVGGAGRDSFDASLASAPAILVGNLGNDTVRGGTGADFLSGDDGADQLFGGAGNDTLLGGGGKDSMTGGDGNDGFEFARPAGGDVILDFVTGVDTLRVSAEGFGGGMFAGMDLAAEGRFVLGGKAKQAFGQFLYNASTGVLRWDADGTGAGGAVTVASLGAGTVLKADDFVVIA